jgi:hypothetical protein
MEVVAVSVGACAALAGAARTIAEIKEKVHTARHIALKKETLLMQGMHNTACNESDINGIILYIVYRLSK